MKLLFDQNLSPRLCRKLDDIFPNSIHVRSIKLEMASDETIWNYALLHEYVIVSKDFDFHERSIEFSFPPKVIMICRGNCSTNEIESILRKNYDQITSFIFDPQTAFLLIDN